MKWSAIRRIVRSGSILSALVGLSLFATLPENFGATTSGDTTGARVVCFAAWAAVAFFLAMIVYIIALLAMMRMPGTIADHESQTTFLAFPFNPQDELATAQDFWRARDQERTLSRWTATVSIFVFLVLVATSAALSARMALEVIPRPGWMPTWLG